jgi:hypothetical protein
MGYGKVPALAAAWAKALGDTPRGLPPLPFIRTDCEVGGVTRKQRNLHTHLDMLLPALLLGPQQYAYRVCKYELLTPAMYPYTQHITCRKPAQQQQGPACEQAAGCTSNNSHQLQLWRIAAGDGVTAFTG